MKDNDRDTIMAWVPAAPVKSLHIVSVGVLFEKEKGGVYKMRTLKRLFISLMTAALVMGNVAALTTFTARAQEEDQSADKQTIGEVSGQTGREENLNACSADVLQENDIMNTDSPDADCADDSDADKEAECTPTVTPAPQQIVTAGGAALEGAQAQAVLNFLDTLKVTEDFAVYADTYLSNESNHVEGNIAVNHLESDNFLVKGNVSEEAEQQGLESGSYSYIGEASGLVGSSDTVVMHGDTELEGSVNDEEGGRPAPGTQNADGTVLVDVSAAVNLEDGTVDVEELANVLESVEQFDADAGEIAETIQINENLNRIADAADAMDQALQDVKVNETVAEEGQPVDAAAVQAVDAVTGMLTDNTLQKGDVVVIDLSIDALTQCAHAENSLQGSLKNLYVANTKVGATLLVRVNTEGTDTITITVPMYQEEHGTANGYLIWDFGSFGGTINANSCVTAGVIVAPNAKQVIVTGTLEGRVVTDTYNREGSSETHQPWMPTPTEDPEVTPTETPNEEPTPTPTEEPEVTPTETPNGEPTPTPTEEPEVTPTETPNEEPTPTPTEEPEVTPTVTITDTPTPTPTTTVTITDIPVPLADTPEEGEVLGARRTPTPVVPEQGEVLGERRAPQTGDMAEINMWLTLLFGAAAGLGTWAFLKKREEKHAQAG